MDSVSSANVQDRSNWVDSKRLEPAAVLTVFKRYLPSAAGDPFALKMRVYGELPLRATASDAKLPTPFGSHDINSIFAFDRGHSRRRDEVVISG